jgi:N-acetylglutamate synthase-like GNAT family acetyltransferase
MPERRGQGVGRLLVTQAIAEARSLGFPAVFLWTESQQAFYRRLGWEEIASTRQGLADVVIMQRVLRG